MWYNGRYAAERERVTETWFGGAICLPSGSGKPHMSRQGQASDKLVHRLEHIKEAGFLFVF